MSWSGNVWDNAAMELKMASDRPHGGERRLDGLAILVPETLKRKNGHLFVFRGGRGGLKVRWHDVSACDCSRTSWSFPGMNDDDHAGAQLGYLPEGIDWRLPQHTWRPPGAR
jgi:transposase